jgi:hypothetical protein
LLCFFFGVARAAEQLVELGAEPPAYKWPGGLCSQHISQHGAKPILQATVTA